MVKVPKGIIIDSIDQADIWLDEYDEWMEQRADEYWEQVDRDMSWQWYMKLKQHQEWATVVVNKDHKSITVKNWISETYPDCNFYNEREHFLIEQHDVATMVALKWS